MCRPAELPIESDLQRLKEYCVKKMTELGNDYELLDVADYRRLRAVIVTRLTLFNTRRGDEPAKMTLEEFAAARIGECLDRHVMMQGSHKITSLNIYIISMRPHISSLSTTFHSTGLGRLFTLPGVATIGPR